VRRILLLQFGSPRSLLPTASSWTPKLAPAIFSVALGKGRRWRSPWNIFCPAKRKH
jgi:hypothetical protein